MRRKRSKEETLTVFEQKLNHYFLIIITTRRGDELERGQSTLVSLVAVAAGQRSTEIKEEKQEVHITSIFRLVLYF